MYFLKYEALLVWWKQNDITVRKSMYIKKIRKRIAAVRTLIGNYVDQFRFLESLVTKTIKSTHTKKNSLLTSNLHSEKEADKNIWDGSENAHKEN